MKQFLLIFSIVAICLISCWNLPTKSNVNSDTINNLLKSGFEEVNVDTIQIDTFQNMDFTSLVAIEGIDNGIDSIRKLDSVVNKSNKFVQLSENESLIKVPDFNHLPIDFFASYSILKHKGKVIFISECPNSNEGDWNMVQQYFFYENGNIKAFSIDYSEYNDLVEDGLIEEHLICYFDIDNKIIKRKFHITNGNGEELDFKLLNIIPTYYNATCAKCLKDLLWEKPFLKR